MTQWTVTFKGNFFPEIVKAKDIHEALAIAKVIAHHRHLEIIKIEYLAY